MATVVRKSRPEPASAPAAPPQALVSSPPAPSAEVPAVAFRDRLALFVWLSGAAIMSALLLKDMVWSLFGLR